jgi:ParB family transcriptional regulator, chromosome partitioning protein
MTADKTRRLGRGLEALLGATASGKPVAESELQHVPIAQIKPNPYQPRKDFKPEELADLEASMKSGGLLQPVTVRTVPGGYELIAGERRLRAASRLGWREIPAVVKDIDDRALLTLALIENLQRADLNPLEEAEGYRRLQEDFALTQQQIADAVGKDRSTVANMLRLLNLPESIRRMLRESQLTLGHARALLAVDDERRMTELALEIVAHGLSVRDVERRARETKAESPAPRQPSATPHKPAGVQTAELRRIQDQLRKHLQTDVQLVLAGKEKGTIRIPFYSADDLERLLDLVLGPKRETL